MTDIIPFESTSAVPAYLQGGNNDDLTAHASTAYPVLSIKGKVFAVVKDGQRMVVPNPKDPESPAHYINVAVIKVSPHTSKVFYMQAFKEGEENVKPTCFSADGETPDPASQQPQCKTCAACPHNVFGSARNADGTAGRGKACSDSVRMAVADLSNIHEPMMLRVPPASIKAIGEYGKVLARRKVPYQGVVTRISFAPEEATPRLVFQPVGYLPQETYMEVVQESKSQMVQSIISGASVVDASAEAPVPAAPEPKPEEKRAAVVEEVVEETKAYATEAAKPAPKPEVKTVSSDEDLAASLDSLGFDE